MSDRVQGFNARDCGDWSRNPSRRPVVWVAPLPTFGAFELTVTMGPDEGTAMFLSREDAIVLARYILALTEGD